MDNKTFDLNLIRASHQRAMLMGFIKSVLQQSTDNKLVISMQNMLVNLIGDMIDHNVMVGDFIDEDVCKLARLHCEKEMAVKEAEEIINDLKT